MEGGLDSASGGCGGGDVLGWGGGINIRNQRRDKVIKGVDKGGRCRHRSDGPSAGCPVGSLPVRC